MDGGRRGRKGCCPRFSLIKGFALPVLRLSDAYKSMLFNVTGYLNLKSRRGKTPKIQLFRFTLNIRIKQMPTNCSYSVEFSSLKDLEELTTYLVKTMRISGEISSCF